MIKKARGGKPRSYNETLDFVEKERRRLLEGMGTPVAAEFVVDAFQKEAIQAVVDGFDTLVVAPTGSGKTFIALEAIKMAVSLGKRSVYTTPLKALSNTKYNDLRERFKGICEVGLLTGDRKIDSNSRIVVATTEIYRNELYSSPSGDAIVVLDEVHFIADEQRGPVWEESIILTPRSSTLLMLSASISNYQEIGDWIGEVRGRPCKIVIQEERPVQLRHGFLHPELGVLPLRDGSGRLEGEVRKYYHGVELDNTGMRLKFGSGRGRGERSVRSDNPHPTRSSDQDRSTGGGNRKPNSDPGQAPRQSGSTSNQSGKK